MEEQSSRMSDERPITSSGLYQFRQGTYGWWVSCFWLLEVDSHWNWAYASFAVPCCSDWSDLLKQLKWKTRMKCEKQQSEVELIPTFKANEGVSCPGSGLQLGLFLFTFSRATFNLNIAHISTRRAVSGSEQVRQMQVHHKNENTAHSERVHRL